MCYRRTAQLYSVPGAEHPDRGSNPAVRCHSTTQPSPVTMWTGKLALLLLLLLLPRLRGTELPSTEGSVSHTIKRAAITAYIQPAHLLHCSNSTLASLRSCDTQRAPAATSTDDLISDTNCTLRPSAKHYDIPDSAQRLNWAFNGVVAQKLHENSATIKNIRSHINCWISH